MTDDQSAGNTFFSVIIRDHYVCKERERERERETYIACVACGACGGCMVAARIYIYMYIYTYEYMYLFIYMCIYTHTLM